LAALLIICSIGTYLVLWVGALLLHDKGKNIPIGFIRLFGLPFVYRSDNAICNSALFRCKSYSLTDLEKVEYAYHAVVGFVAVWVFTFKNEDELVLSGNRPGMNRLLMDLECILPGFSLEKWKQEFAQGDVVDTLILWEAKLSSSPIDSSTKAKS
jgi:hypothetical protein